ncbi:hypothetical protein [Methylobacterium brachythecii]|nr:hypothetical protein [Methylobacterium brachythecii]
MRPCTEPESFAATTLASASAKRCQRMSPTRQSELVGLSGTTTGGASGS